MYMSFTPLDELMIKHGVDSVLDNKKKFKAFLSDAYADEISTINLLMMAYDVNVFRRLEESQYSEIEFEHCVNILQKNHMITRDAAVYTVTCCRQAIRNALLFWNNKSKSDEYVYCFADGGIKFSKYVGGERCYIPHDINAVNICVIESSFLKKDEANQTCSRYEAVVFDFRIEKIKVEDRAFCNVEINKMFLPVDLSDWEYGAISACTIEELYYREGTSIVTNFLDVHTKVRNAYIPQSVKKMDCAWYDENTVFHLCNGVDIFELFGIENTGQTINVKYDY